MKNINYIYTDSSALQKFIDDKQLKNAKNLLIQIFSGVCDEELLMGITATLKERLPQASIIGVTTAGEIVEGRMLEKQIALSFSIFETTQIRSKLYENDGEEQCAKQITEELVTEKTKALILFSDGLHSNGEEILRQITLIHPNLVVAGGRAGDYHCFQKTLIFNENAITGNGFVAASLSGDDLIVRSSYMLNWDTIGEEMVATKAEKNRLFTINNLPAIEMYRKYLGEEIASSLPESGVEFPLIMKRGEVDVARAPIAAFEDGSLLFGGNINEGEKLKFGFGNLSMVQEKSFENYEKFLDMPVEATYIYSCSARKALLGNELEVEFDYLQSIAPTIGFFTYGEYFHSEVINELLNITSTFLSLSESSVIPLREKPTVSKISQRNRTQKALSHLVGVTSMELTKTNQMLYDKVVENDKIKESLNEGQRVAKYGSWEWDINSDTIWWSDEIYRIFGLQPREFTATYEAFLEQVHPDDRAAVKKAIKHTLTHNVDYRIEHRLLPQSGQQRYVREEGQVKKDSLGNPIKIIGTVQDITEQKNIQLELSHKEEQLVMLAQAIKQSDNFIKIVSKKGIILFANEAMAHHSGYSSSELIGAHTSIFKSGHHDDLFYKNLWESVLQGKTVRATFINRKKDGTFFSEEESITPIVDEDGQINYFVSTGKDITERLEIENALRRSESNFRNIFDNSSDGIIIYDLEGKILEVNQVQCVRLGYTKEELIGHNITMMDSPKNGETLSAITEILQKEGHAIFEGEHLKKDGATIPVEIHATMITYMEQPTVLSVVRDISERKESEQAIYEAEELHRMMFNLSPVGILLLDPQTGKAVEFNQNTYEALGYSAEEFMELDLSDYEVNESPEEIAKHIESLMDGSNEVFETRHRTKDGKIRNVSVSTQLISLRGKQYLFTFFNDITEQKEYEDTLEAAKRSAEEANSAKSNFLANMSHEIRTPMNGILGLIQLSYSLDLPPKAQEYLIKIEKSSQLLLHIINDILDFSKIEANRLEIAADLFDLNDVIGQLSALFGDKADAKGVEFTIKVAPNTPAKLVGDSIRLSQILNNLVSNALKFTREGEVETSIAVLKSDADKVTIEFIVKDTGIGIAEDDLHKLFESFSQVDGSITRKYGGTGLGLSISKRLAELMGGTLDVSSEEGVGSSFSLVVEFGVVDATSHYYAYSPVKKGLDILVVDDQENARMILKEMLESWSCNVDESENGEDALKMIGKKLKKGKMYDLIMVDWNMPGINGIETIQEIRALEEKKQTEHSQIVMMVTAYSRDTVLENVDNEQIIDAFLNKPVTYSSLYEAFNSKGLHAKLQTPFNKAERENFIAITAPIRGASVLLVEDNEINIQVESDFLHQMGMKVTVVTDGLQAIQLLEQKRFDVVLMDYQMPVMDGVEATEVLRSRGDTIPIIAMTAAAMQNDRKRCINAGMNDYLSKPIDFLKLAQVLIRWIAPREQNSETMIPVLSLQEDDLPEIIQGIDKESGLKNSANNPRLYRDILRQFIQQYERGCKPLEEMIGKQEHGEAKRWVHTLKGVSATIGANLLHEQISAVESKLEKNETVDLKALCTMLSTLVEELETLKKPTSAQINLFDYRIVLEKLKIVSEKLSNNQPVGQEHIHALETALGDYGKKPIWMMLKQALENFEYDRGQELMDKLYHQIEENHESI